MLRRVGERKSANARNEYGDGIALFLAWRGSSQQPFFACLRIVDMVFSMVSFKLSFRHGSDTAHAQPYGQAQAAYRPGGRHDSEKHAEEKQTL